MSQERDGFLRDIAITAVEGGIGYWASCKRYKWSADGTLDNMLKFPKIRIVPAEDPDDFEEQDITVTTIRKGLRAICDGTVEINSEYRKTVLLADKENDACHIDADLADLIVQAGLFDKIVFG